MAYSRRITRFRVFGCIGLLAGGGALIALVAGLIGYTVKQAREKRARAEVKRELAAIRDRGEPTTAGELDALYHLPSGVPDTTTAWWAGMAVVNSQEFATDVKSFSSNHLDPYPVTERPWPQAADATKFLEKYAPALAAFELAASQPGAIRYPTEPQAFLSFGSGHIKHAIDAEWFLAFAAKCRAYEGDSRAAARLLITRFRFVRSNPYEPYYAEQFERMGAMMVNVNWLEKLLPQLAMTDSELAELQTELRANSLEQGLPLGLVGIRTFMLDPRDSRGDRSHETGIYLKGNSQQEDLAFCLPVVAELLAAARRPWPAALQDGERIHAEWQAKSNGYLSKDRRDILELHDCRELIQYTARAIAARDGADAALAVERYRLANGKWPDSLAEVAPAYLPRIPHDSIQGDPLRLLKNEDGSVTICFEREDARDHPAHSFRLPSRAAQ